MKKILIICSSILAILLSNRVQAYPYWDSTEPGEPDSESYFFGSVVATTNSTFGIVGNGTDTAVISRWQKCGGWESLPDLSVLRWSTGTAFQQKMMAIHDHYLYAVGFFQLAGYTNVTDNSDLFIYPDGAGEVPSNTVQIARFDFNTGHWTPLGQSFSARNVEIPTTIDVDASNRIYVGFQIFNTNGWYGTVDMLDVSTNEGASWQIVGEGLDVVEPGTEEVGISALCADGTNLYIGGDFDGYVSGGSVISSPEVVMRADESWRALDGVSYLYPYLLNYYWGFGEINAIVGMGTNIYVTGIFSAPESGIARFSNVTGHSLPVGDPADYLGWALSGGSAEIYGTGLAINNGKLYLTGQNVYGSVDGVTNFACLADPQDSYPTEWTTLSGSVGIGAAGIVGLAGVTNGNAIYASGSDPSDNFPNVNARWVTGPDISPTAVINNVTWQGSGLTLDITGTSGIPWQVMYSTDDGTTWHQVGVVTLWGGTNIFTDTSYVVGETVQYQLVNDCSSSDVFTPSHAMVTIVAGNGSSGYTGDGGQATNATLSFGENVADEIVFGGIAMDSSGNLYIADTGNNVVRKVGTDGIIHTFAGNGTAGYLGDTGAAISAELNGPTGLACDGKGNLYIADHANNVVRKVDSSGNIWTVAGDGSAGYSGDGGVATSANLNDPIGLACNTNGNLYIADSGNTVIREVDTNDVISTVAGSYYLGVLLGNPSGYLSNGAAATSEGFSEQGGLAVDGLGDIYMTDPDISVAGMVDTNDVFWTVAGNSDGGTTYYPGDGGAATSAYLETPAGVAVDGGGDFYFTDEGSASVRMMDTSGNIWTVVGSDGGTTFLGFPAYDPGLSSPSGILVAPDGSLYIVDTRNNVVRKVVLY